MNSLYHAAKYAVVGFSESLNYELAPFNVRVKVVCPGGVSTDFAGRSLATTFKTLDNPYGASITKTMAAFRSNPARYSTPEFIAAGLYDAAVDGTRNVRYVLGADAVARWETRQKITDEQYVLAVEKWMEGA